MKFYSQFASQLSLKSQKEKEKPIYEMSLNFSNNLLQTFIIDIFDKANISFQTDFLNLEDSPYQSNIIRVTYKNIIYFLIFQCKNDFINNVHNSDILLETIEYLTKHTESNNITLILYQGNFDLNEKNEKGDFKYFIQTEMNIKYIDISNSNELIDYLYNYIESLINKEYKSKLTFFQSKPVQITNLCDIENIKNKDFIKHLMCINGISEMKAIAIVKEYPTLSSLYDIYLSDQYNENEKKSLLENIEIENKAKGTIKKIGKVLSEKIYKYYINKESNCII